MADSGQSGGDALSRTYQAYVTQRFLTLDRFDRYVTQEQYVGAKDFFDDDVPLFKRAPCLVLGHTQEAIRSHASMVSGEGRFPRLTTHGDEDDTDLDSDFGLSPEDSAIVDPFLGKIVKDARLQTAGRRLVEAALSCGTAVAVGCARKGRLAVDNIPAKYCAPQLSPDGDVLSVEIRYPYVVEEKDRLTQRLVEKVKLYRRTIDDTSDVTYKPADGREDGREPVWQIASSFKHDFGFCPVVWWKCMADTVSPAEIDGYPIHRTILEELYHLDLARSQLHRAALTTLDPIMVETGVEPGFSPAPLVELVKSMDGLFMGNPMDPARNQWGVMPRGQGNVGRGRKRAPGMAYQYPLQATVDYLTIPGDALKAGFDNVKSLEEHICDLLHWRPIDPSSALTSALSGRALEWLHKKQIDYDNELRVDFADHMLLPLVNMLLRIALALSQREDKVTIFLPGIDQVSSILERFQIDQDDGKGGKTSVWVCPVIDAVWPPYFPPSEQDAFALGNTVRSDLKANIITRRTAVERMASFYQIRDVDAYLEALEKEKLPDLGIDPATGPVGASGAAGGAGGAPGAQSPVGGPSGPSGAPSGSPVAGGSGGGASSAPASSGSGGASAATLDATATQAAPDAHLSNSASQKAAQDVYDQLIEDFPTEALAWVKTAAWQGPMRVPLTQIDFSNKDTWAASNEPDKVSDFSTKINKGVLKPIVLVNEPNNEKMICLDGHHRLLAYEQLGRDALAYVATVGSESGPWMQLHNKQSDGGASV